MEVLQNIGASSSLQSLMASSQSPTAATVSGSSDNPNVHTGVVASNTNSIVATHSSSQPIDNHLLDSLADITDHTLLDLQNIPADHDPMTNKSSIADIILGSGDNSCTPDSTAFKHLPNTHDGHNTTCNSTAAHETGIVLDNLATAVVAEEPEESPEVNVAINNVVCTFSTRCHLNLREIALNGCNVELKKAQGMLNMKIRKPSATASIWSSGKITVTGANSEDNCRIAARRIARSLQRIGFPVKFSSFKIVNVLGTCSLPFGIRLTDFSRENIGKVQYEPELHPGATYKIRDISATLKIFSTGSITITAPKVQNIQLAVEHVFPLVYPYKKPKKVDPKELEYIKGILEEDSEVELISDNSDLELEDGEIPTNKTYRYSQPVKYQQRARAAPSYSSRSASTYSSRKQSIARLPDTVINDDDYGSSSDDDDMGSDDSD